MYLGMAFSALYVLAIELFHQQSSAILQNRSSCCNRNEHTKQHRTLLPGACTKAWREFIVLCMVYSLYFISSTVLMVQVFL